MPGPLAGDAELGESAVALGKRLWEKRVGSWLPALLDSGRRSQDEHGDVAFLLEPDLKESRGGQRDLQVLSLMADSDPGRRCGGQRPTARKSRRLTPFGPSRAAAARPAPERTPDARGPGPRRRRHGPGWQGSPDARRSRTRGAPSPGSPRMPFAERAHGWPGLEAGPARPTGPSGRAWSSGTTRWPSPMGLRSPTIRLWR